MADASYLCGPEDVVKIPRGTCMPPLEDRCALVFLWLHRNGADDTMPQPSSAGVWKGQGEGQGEGRSWERVGRGQVEGTLIL